MDRAAGMSGGRGDVELVEMDSGTGAVVITVGMTVEGADTGGIRGAVSTCTAGESHFSLSSGGKRKIQKKISTKLILLK